jgi:hypothetical protein
VPFSKGDPFEVGDLMAVVRNMAGEKLAEVRIRKRIRMHLFIRTLGAYEYYANIHLQNTADALTNKLIYRYI